MIVFVINFHLSVICFLDESKKQYRKIWVIEKVRFLCFFCENEFSKFHTKNIDSSGE